MPKEYIEREAAIDRLEKLFQLQAPTARAIIEAIPAANVREVVLCRDCIHLNRKASNMNGFYRCDRYDAWRGEDDRVHMPLDGFCIYGDRGADMRGEADGT